MQKALEEDSTVYDYDAVYDDIQKQRNESNKKILGGTDKRVMSFMLNTGIHCICQNWYNGYLYGNFLVNVNLFFSLLISPHNSQSISTS